MTEAQRLITISLGKIAASRCQRSGINLHKNLLVSTVLNRARNVFYEESLRWYNSRQALYQPQQMDYRDPHEYDSDSECEVEADVSEPCMPTPPACIEASPCNALTGTYTTSTCTVLRECSYELDSDKENVTPFCNAAEQSELYAENKVTDIVSSFDCPLSQSSNCDTTIETTTVDGTQSYTLLTSPTKRKMSEVEAAVESIQPKRQRCMDSFDADFCREQLHTEPINTLVNYFNSGFSSLLTENSDTDHRTGFSCWSAHDRPILDSFESVSPPVIVMTV